MRAKYGFVLKFTIVAALLGFFSPSLRKVSFPDGTQGVALKLLSQVEARRGGRGGGFRGGGGRSFRGGGMRSRPSFNRSRSGRSVRSSRNYGGNFYRAPKRTRPVSSRPKTQRPASKRPGANRPAQKRPNSRPGSKQPVTTQPVNKPSPTRPNRPGAGERPGRPGQGDRPNRPGKPGEKPITIQPIVNPGTGKPMPGQPGHRPPGLRPPGDRPPGTRPPGHRPPGVRPPHERPPHGRPPHRPPHHGGPGWDDWHDDYWYWPVGAVATGVVIGSLVATLPSDCNTEVVNGTTYYYCNGTWYLPYYEGSVLKYRVVSPPR